MCITTRSASAFMRSAGKDLSAWSSRMTRTTIRCPQISPPQWACARAFSTERAFTSVSQRRGSNLPKYGFLQCRNRAYNEEFDECCDVSISQRFLQYGWAFSVGYRSELREMRLH